jgi:hypothetical protein
MATTSLAMLFQSPWKSGALGSRRVNWALLGGPAGGRHRAIATHTRRGVQRRRLALLDRKREVLVGLRREGAIDDSVARQVQTRIDPEELRLTGVE